MNVTETPTQVGTRVGKAIAGTVLAEDLPREWTGIDPQDADQFAVAGIVYGSPEWADAEKAAEAEYVRLIVSEGDDEEEVETTYTLNMRDDGGSTHSVEIDDPDDAAAFESEIEDWVQEGDWGDDGASVSVYWWVVDQDGDEVSRGNWTVEIPQDQEAAIAKACGRNDGCGGSPDDHDWTFEGEVGCTENPGVWSVGGTAMIFTSHCKACGLRRRERHCGSQRNPGEHDTTEYEMPSKWCAECQSEECECEAGDE